MPNPPLCINTDKLTNQSTQFINTETLRPPLAAALLV